MKDHPLTPMRDASLIRVMAAQSRYSVGHVGFAAVNGGADQIRRAMADAVESGHRYVVVDAIDDDHLRAIGAAISDHRLLTGGSGIGVGLVDNFVAQGLMQKSPPAEKLEGRPGRAAILAGSCSKATRGQVAAAIDAGVPAMRIDPLALGKGQTSPDDAIAWATAQAAGRPVLVYSSDEPDNVRAIQDRLGVEAAGTAVERHLGAIASGLAEAGFTRIIVAGGETSGAVIDALGVKAIEIGPEIDPGVPWTRSTGDDGLVLSFKSGNFGAPDFFLKAWDYLS